MNQFIISIDVGIKNLGICVFDCASDSVCYWNSESIVASGRYMPLPSMCMHSWGATRVSSTTRSACSSSARCAATCAS